jgi:N-methylhydantoinase A
VEVSAPAARGEAAPVGSRRVDGTDVPVYAREDLPAGGLLAGPAIVAELDSTTWIPSGVRAEVHASGAFVMSL